VPFAICMPSDNDKEFLRGFGEAVRSRRKERGLSQEAFADEIPLYRSYVADVERGARNVGLVNAMRIAKALGLPLSQLIADAEHGERRQ
jgi:transcriptional regulator with XRE-family HTH domain